ncbi:MAG: hypothetical protein IKF09_03310 [Clostridiales bacterium]|nr:hypothetical protein [Clostridiales bacterium]
MNENETLKAGNEFLLSRNFDKARELFNKVLDEDPDNIRALRGKMFCDLKITEITEIKTKTVNEGKRVPYDRYAKFAPEKYSGYFTDIKEYFKLYAENIELGCQIAENEKRSDSFSTMIAESSVKEGMRGLFGGHMFKMRNGRQVKSPPDIIGLIVFAIVNPLTVVCSVLEKGVPWPGKICICFFILFITGLFAYDGFKDIKMIINGKSVLNTPHEDVEAETAGLCEQLEKNTDAKDSLYFKIRDMDLKIMKNP